MGEDYPYEAKGQIVTLVETLGTLTKRDPEQEVQGIDLPVLDQETPGTLTAPVGAYTT